MSHNMNRIARILRAPLVPSQQAHAVERGEEFVGYPDNQVLGIFDKRDDAARALDEASEAGIPETDITVYSGDDGAEAIDSSGTEHGVAETLQRSVQRLLTNEDDLRVYERAASEGGVVLAIEAKDDERKESASALLQRHGARDVRHFGTFVVQDLDVDPSRTMAD